MYSHKKKLTAVIVEAARSYARSHGLPFDEGLIEFMDHNPEDLAQEMVCVLMDVWPSMDKQ